jgi:hypothetical protein
VGDPAIRAEAAAALAAVHLPQRFQQWQQAPFDRGELMAAPGGGPRALPPFALYYEESFAHIGATSRTLFAGDGPSLRGLHQGLLGDCYFVATLGALVARNPADVGRFVQPAPEGGFQVRFPNGEAVRVSGVSDAEIALGSYALGQGLWLNVLEKAYGTLVARSLQRKRIFEDPVDAVGSGGLATSAMSLLTGCAAGVLQFRPDDAPTTTSELRVDGFVPLARAQLRASIDSRRLICCGTTKAATPPGIAKIHLYAVLDFDPQTEVVELWNPWGNEFEPHGPPGLEHGYRVRQGRFSVPLRDVIRIFGSLVYETDRPQGLE